MNLQSIAHALGGNINGKQVLAPGAGHSRHDRGLAPWIDLNSTNGFRVHSHAGDDFKLCRDHVRERLGVPDWQSSSGKISAPRPVTTIKVVETRHDDADHECIERGNDSMA